MTTVTKTKAEQLRDAGMQQVLFHNEDWRLKATYHIAELAGSEVTGEDIRKYMETEHECFPNHHNAWGGWIGGLVKSGILQPTGEFRKMTEPKSHARKTQVYRVL